MATFSNPRWDALPCEMMRGCSFADDFLTELRIEQNHGASGGAGGTVDHGVTFANNGYYEYDIVSQTSGFSVTVRFLTSETVSGRGPLITNATAGTAGFWIYLTPTGVLAQHGNGAEPHDACEVAISYADGEIHTVTYAVDMTGGTHSLYVDALDVVTETTAIDETIGDVDNVIVGKYSTSRFTGTIYKPRIFDALLTEEEHDVYHADTLETFFMAPLASYRCDSFNDDRDGYYLWDRTTNRRDLGKGDRTDDTTFPEYETDKYLFDFVNDYVSGLFELPTEYTVTAALSTPQEPYPTITQENDTTLLDDLTTSGLHWGYLHSLTIHAGVLTQLELYQAEYQHQYWLSRGRASGIYHRLITEGTCKLAMFLDAGISVYRDHSLGTHQGTGHDVTRDGADGCLFPNAASHMLVYDDPTLRVKNITIAVLGTFTGVEAAGTIIDKGTNCKLLTNGNQIDFNGSTISHTFANNQQIAVTCKSGLKPRFFVDGEYIGEGSTIETPDDTDTTDVTIGNNNELTEGTQYPIRQIYLGDKALSDAEIKALFDNALAIGASTMETGTRIETTPEVFTAIPVDFDKDPGGPYQLIDVVVEFDIAPVTSEDITIKSIRNSTDIPEDVFDPSTSSNLKHMFRFDKRLANTAPYGVDYANSDNRTITIYSTYQTDPSIG